RGLPVLQVPAPERVVGVGGAPGQGFGQAAVADRAAVVHVLGVRGRVQHRRFPVEPTHHAAHASQDAIRVDVHVVGSGNVGDAIIGQPDGKALVGSVDTRQAIRVGAPVGPVHRAERVVVVGPR